MLTTQLETNHTNPSRSSIEMSGGRLCNIITEISLVDKPKLLSNTLLHTTGTSQSILRTPYQRNNFFLHFKVKLPIVKVSYIKGRWTWEEDAEDNMSKTS